MYGRDGHSPLSTAFGTDPDHTTMSTFSYGFEGMEPTASDSTVQSKPALARGPSLHFPPPPQSTPPDSPTDSPVGTPPGSPSMSRSSSAPSVGSNPSQSAPFYEYSEAEVCCVAGVVVFMCIRRHELSRGKCMNQ